MGMHPCNLPCGVGDGVRRAHRPSRGGGARWRGSRRRVGLRLPNDDIIDNEEVGSEGERCCHYPAGQPSSGVRLPLHRAIFFLRLGRRGRSKD